ncbi:MAG: glycosyltransferase [Desulfobacteraceae bacterium]|jgi:processive 1,2-diacylglycerol beta-glucosyltransferase
MPERPLRLLILSASVGAGHLRAAQAVELALKAIEPKAEVRNQDTLELTNRTFRRLYGQAYLDLVNRAPHVLGYLYDLLDRPRGPKQKSDRLRVLVERLNLRKVLKLLQSEPWDIIINTHFLSAEIIASLRSDNEVGTPHMTVTTDYETHRLWVTDPCDHYCTATEEGAAYLEHWGVNRRDITVTGIPIHPAFSRHQDRATFLQSQGLVGDRTIVLQLAGGFGVGPIEKIYRGLLEIDVPLEIVAVAGRNEEIKKEIKMIQVPLRHRSKVIGFTEKIHELMGVTDLVISKPGGLTTSEVLASGAVMAIINPVPGQETRNSDFLLENGAAIKINNVATLPYKLTRLLGDKERLRQLKQNAARLARPQAAFDVAKIAVRLARSRRSMLQE